MKEITNQDAYPLSYPVGWKRTGTVFPEFTNSNTCLRCGIKKREKNND